MLFERRTLRRRLTGVGAGAVAGLTAAGMVAATPADADRLPTLPIGTADYTVHVNAPGGSDGKIFYTTGMAAAVPFAVNVPGLDQFGQSNVIADKSGKVLWKYTPPKGQSVANFRTQAYQGRKVLTWWQGTGGGGHGAGTDIIADVHGRVIKRVTLGGSIHPDVHEFRLTPDGRALITSYVPVKADLSSVGGPRDGTMLDCVASVVDVASNKVLMQWSARDHIPITDSGTRPSVVDASGLTSSSIYDPFHMNSIVLDPSGDLLMSFRNLNAIYNVDLQTGKVKWRLGGTRPDFAMGSGTATFGQHDAEYVDASTIRVFDNNIIGTRQQGTSSIKWIRLDSDKRTATLVREQQHSAGIASAAMGNAQALPDGNTFGSWGFAPHIAEFSRSGKLVYDATLPVGTYRAYLNDWP
ncbi:arylsulfotransferase family protein [Gordonia sp. CPCC 206044]|uniref:arylsulfotransferase family protein n=1 Tax=Gordonia sp. CPCC 206044 TaxID=3140793 RepID=UPI003AF3BAE2